MNSILFQLFDQRICLRLTETLLHFVWEGLAIGGCTLCLAWLCRTASSRVRYAVHAVSLALMALCVPITFVVIGSPELPQMEHNSLVVSEPELSGSVTSHEVVSGTTITPESVEARPVNSASNPLPSEVSSVDALIPETNAIRAIHASRFESTLRQCAPYTAGAYFLGVIGMMIRLCCALWGGHRLRRCAVPVSDRKLLRQIRSQASRMGLKFLPVVAYCERIAIPVVAGILRPMILLPLWIATEMDPEQVLVILTHEMAHIRRSDLLVNLLQRLLETILFFHPVVWYVSRQLSFERENCCDDAVVQAGYESVQYASALVRMAELCASNRRPIPTTLLALAASGSSGSELKRRIVRLLNDPQRLRLTRGDSLTLLLMIGLIIGTMAGFWRQTFAAPSNNLDANAVDAKQAVAGNSKELEFTGKVVDADDKPVTGAEIWLAFASYRSDDPTIPSTVRKMAMSDQQGDFSFQFEPIKADEGGAARWSPKPRVFAKAAGYGCDWLPLEAFEKNPVSSASRDALEREVDESIGSKQFSSRTLKLPREAGPVSGRLIDLEGNPVPGVVVSIESLENVDLTQMNEAFEKSSRDIGNKAMWGRSLPGGNLSRVDWQTFVPSAKTNENGEFSLSGLGRGQMAAVTLLGERVAAERLYILGTEMETKRLPHISFYPNGAQDVFVGTRFSHVAGPAVPVSGVVTEFKSGKPIANATVFVERLFSIDGRMSVVQLRMWTNHIRAVTDANGRYQLIGVPPGAKHVLNVAPPKTEPWLIASQQFSVDSGVPNVTVDVQVFRGIWLEGRVTDEATGEPIKGRVDYLALQTNPNIPQRFGLEDAWRMDRFPTDESGNYRVAGLPGPGVLLVRSFGETVYPLSVGSEKIPGYEAKGNYLPTTPTGMPLVNWNRVDYIDPAVDAPSHTLDLTLSAGPSFVGRIVGPNDSPVSNLEAFGLNEKGGFYEKLKDDKFSIHNYVPTVPRNLFFKTADDSLVGYLHVEGAPPADLTVRLQPGVTVRGRLIETDLDDVAVGYHLYCQSSNQGQFRINDTTTDENGRFEIKGLWAGNVYKMDTSNVRRFSTGQNRFKIDLTDAKPGDVIELGDVTGKHAKVPQ